MTNQPEMSREDWLWMNHCYVWGISCGHHDETCDGPHGHWNLSQLAGEQR